MTEDDGKPVEALDSEELLGDGDPFGDIDAEEEEEEGSEDESGDEREAVAKGEAEQTTTTVPTQEEETVDGSAMNGVTQTSGLAQSKGPIRFVGVENTKQVWWRLTPETEGEFGVFAAQINKELSKHDMDDPSRIEIQEVITKLVMDEIDPADVAEGIARHREAATED